MSTLQGSSSADVQDSTTLDERNDAAHDLMDRLGVEPIPDNHDAADEEVACVNGDDEALKHTVTQGQYIVAVVELPGNDFILGPMKGYQYRDHEKRGTFSLLAELTGNGSLDASINEVPLIHRDGEPNPKAVELLRNQQWLQSTTSELMEN